MDASFAAVPDGATTAEIRVRNFLPGGEIEVPVETWIYNLGPNKLMRRIRFEDGIVVEIETLGYGYWTQPTAPP